MPSRASCPLIALHMCSPISYARSSHFQMFRGILPKLIPLLIALLMHLPCIDRRPIILPSICQIEHAVDFRVPEANSVDVLAGNHKGYPINMPMACFISDECFCSDRAGDLLVPIYVPAVSVHMLYTAGQPRFVPVAMMMRFDSLL